MRSRTRNGSIRPLVFFLFGAVLFGVSPDPVSSQGLPPDEAGSVAHLDASPRHGEWVDYDAGNGDMVRAWVVYPERPDAAPVVVVIHEIYALTDWIRSVADQLAAYAAAGATDLMAVVFPTGDDAEASKQRTIELLQGLVGKY